MIIPLQPPTFAVVEYLQISQHIWNPVETLAVEGDYRIICFTSDAAEAERLRDLLKATREPTLGYSICQADILANS
mgnify:CR=1 FL=1